MLEFLFANLIYLLPAVVGTLLVVIILVKRWRLRAIERQPLPDEERFQLEQIELHEYEEADEYDREAYKIIREYRQHIWLRASLNTPLKFKEIFKRCHRLVHDIAKCYHPYSSNPEFEVPLVELLDLVHKVTRSLSDSMNQLAFIPFTRFTVNEIMRYKDWYDFVKTSRMYDFLQRNPKLMKTARWLWIIQRTTSLRAVLWRLSWTTGKEAAVRQFYTMIITRVGEEAVEIYGAHQSKKLKTVQEEAIMAEIANITLAGGSELDLSYKKSMSMIIENTKIDDSEKIKLLYALVRGSRQRGCSPKLFKEPSEIRYMLKRLEKMATLDQKTHTAKLGYLKELSAKFGEEYKNQVALSPVKGPVHITESEQKRKEHQIDEKVLLLMIYAANLENKLEHHTVRRYLQQWAEGSTIPFKPDELEDLRSSAPLDEEIEDILKELPSTYHRQKAFESVTDLLLKVMPFSRREDRLVTEWMEMWHLEKLCLKDYHEKLYKVFGTGKLIVQPSLEYVKYTLSLLKPDEHIQACQPTGSQHQFREGDDTGAGSYWLVVTDSRLLFMAYAKLPKTTHEYHLSFKIGVSVIRQKGRVYDTYIFSAPGGEDFQVDTKLRYGSSFLEAVKLRAKVRT